MKTSRYLRTLSYFQFLILFVTGTIVFFLFDKIGFVSDELGKLNSYALKIHGIVGLGFFMFIGYLIQAHIRPNLKAKRSKKSGLILTTIVFALLVTVPFLYYATSDSTRTIASFFHSYAGFALTLSFIGHVIVARVRAKTAKSFRVKFLNLSVIPNSIFRVFSNNWKSEQSSSFNDERRLLK